jgi:hypothetical protein
VGALLPDALARLAAGGGAGALQSLWRAVIGGAIAERTRPLRFAGGVLHVEVPSPTWRATLESEEPALRARLNAVLRQTRVDRLVFEVRRPAAP